MIVDYSMIKNALILEDGNCIITYGIEARNSTDGELLDIFEDVSVNSSFTENIIDILNTCKIEICHFRDVIIDELNK